METQTLYDLSPALRVMFMGLVVAMGPLAWIWLRNRQASTTRRLQALTVLTLFLTFDLVMFGSFTRLTDSGLGCPDWPGCYGNASPVGAHAEISAAQQAMPTGPVTHGKAWVEMVHRYLATGVGVLIAALAFAEWWARGGFTASQSVRIKVVRSMWLFLWFVTGVVALKLIGAMLVLSVWWARQRYSRGEGAQASAIPFLTLFWVCVQGAFGALTVTMKLFPAIVTLHLLGGLLLLALLALQAVRYAQMHDAATSRSVSPGLRQLLWWALGLLTLQIALGGWVSTNYAVLACTEFPRCQGAWWPEMNFAQGFELWRELGFTSAGEHIDFAALTAVHYMHRIAAYAVIAVLAALVWRLRALAPWRSTARWLAALLLLQFLTGLSNVVLDWPLLAAVLHTGGAGAMVVLLTWSLASSHTADASTASPDSVSSSAA